MNISQLAKKLGVSVTTVSRVLSGNAAKYRISPRTAEWVREAAEAHRVAPDPIGAGLRSGGLGLIGLLLPDITNPFFSSLARCVERELRRHGMAVLLADSNEDMETEQTQLAAMLGRKLDGLLLLPVGRRSDELTKLLDESSTPMVMLDRILPDFNGYSVSLDNYEAGRLAVESLIARGHRRIGCLRGDPETVADSERFRGLSAAFEVAGVPIDESIVKGAGYSRGASLRMARAILDADEPPSALLTLSGQGILSVLEVVNEKGLSIPEALSVIAFDEQPWASFLNPPLATVVQPVQEMAEESVALLRALVRKQKPSKKSVVLRARIEERASIRQFGVG